MVRMVGRLLRLLRLLSGFGGSWRIGGVGSMRSMKGIWCSGNVSLCFFWLNLVITVMRGRCVRTAMKAEKEDEA